MDLVLGTISFLIITIPIYPYFKDMVTGRAIPSRSTRTMFVVLLVLGLLQQKSLGTGMGLWLLTGELIGSIFVFFASLKYGEGGLSKIDIYCYLLLILDIGVWAVTKNALIAVFLTMTADIIALAPTVAKLMRNQKSETYLWWLFGVIAPVFSVLSEGSFELKKVLFQTYLLFANLAIVLLIVVPRSKNTKSEVVTND